MLDITWGLRAAIVASVPGRPAVLEWTAVDQFLCEEEQFGICKIGVHSAFLP